MSPPARTPCPGMTGRLCSIIWRHVPVEAEAAGIAPFRMAVQWVNRPDQDFRGYAGTIASGRVRPGDAIAILPSGRTSRIARIVTAAGDLDEASAGQAVTLTLTDEVDCSRGDMIAAAGAVTVSGALDATLVWMNEEPLEPHRAYWLKTGAQSVSATVTVGEVMAINGGANRPGPLLALNDIGRVRIALDRRIAATAYADNRALGGFILIDKATHVTVAAGMIGGFPSGGPARRPCRAHLLGGGRRAGGEAACPLRRPGPFRLHPHRGRASRGPVQRSRPG